MKPAYKKSTNKITPLDKLFGMWKNYPGTTQDLLNELRSPNFDRKAFLKKVCS